MVTYHVAGMKKESVFHFQPHLGPVFKEGGLP